MQHHASRPGDTFVARAVFVYQRPGHPMLEELKEKITGEIERLGHELQITLPEAIKRAVEHGDLKENSEYKSALERQQFVQARLNHLTRRLGELSAIDESTIPEDRVGFGSRVTVKDAKTGQREEYVLVFGDDIDIDAGQISIASPIGQALGGKKVGETAVISLPRGQRTLEILDLVTLPQMVGSGSD
jgi:transcription elongation factor GreA